MNIATLNIATLNRNCSGYKSHLLPMTSLERTRNYANHADVTGTMRMQNRTANVQCVSLQCCCAIHDLQKAVTVKLTMLLLSIPFCVMSDWLVRLAVSTPSACA